MVTVVTTNENVVLRLDMYGHHVMNLGRRDTRRQSTGTDDGYPVYLNAKLQFFYSSFHCM